MVWTPPNAYPAGTLITPTIYGDEIIGNLLDLYNLQTHECDGYEFVTLTVVATPLGYLSILADTLDINGMLGAEWMLLITTDAVRTTNLKVRWSFDDMLDIDVVSAGAGTSLALIRLWMCNTGADDSQIFTGEWLLGTSITPGVEAAWAVHDYWYNTAAVGTDVNHPLYLRVTLSAAAAGYIVRLVGHRFFGPNLVD